MAINNYQNSRGGLKTTLKGSAHSRTSFWAGRSDWEASPLWQWCVKASWTLEKQQFISQSQTSNTTIKYKAWSLWQFPRKNWRLENTSSTIYCVHTSRFQNEFSSQITLHNILLYPTLQHTIHSLRNVQYALPCSHPLSNQVGHHAH